MNTDDIQPGEVYRVGAACGVPHGFRPIQARIIRVHTWPTWEGMAWLDVYELNTDGYAAERRSIYVIAAGLERIPHTTPAVPAARRRPTNAGPARIPRPRTSPEPTIRRNR